MVATRNIWLFKLKTIVLYLTSSISGSQWPRQDVAAILDSTGRQLFIITQSHTRVLALILLPLKRIP